MLSSILLCHFEIQTRGRACVYMCPSYSALGEPNRTSAHILATRPRQGPEERRRTPLASHCVSRPTLLLSDGKEVAHMSEELKTE
uniref:Uncharacterized protein n=1 Tax=Molossus molossus TaxID=27622 RepID=A0A7J8I2H2_MOLMO|nr:hypothetical protein HJG59_012681 [Molossus molossus]